MYGYILASIPHLFTTWAGGGGGRGGVWGGGGGCVFVGFLCIGKYKPLFFISTPSGLDDVNNMSEAKTERF